ncbi:hypothetical protein SASPL_151704 [Salvia splendens]|uniref:Uncharacterized protein n=1 Tax=Salvia splendens TaxID=180675 RepID=A0A8X8W226_SALSN|nr:hypothetical protein SASPL_151704 [Salvia splendens]
MTSLYYYGGNSMPSIDEFFDDINKMHKAPATMIFHHQQQQQQQQQAPVVHKKVHFTESEERVEVDGNGGKHQVCEERTIDMEADGFIKKRHKNFESCNTYKGY